MLLTRRPFLLIVVAMIVLALVAFVAVVPASARADVPATSSISGRVLGQTADGGTIPMTGGTLVLSLRPTGAAVTAPLDRRPDGTYTFSGLVPGTYTVRLNLSFPSIYVRSVQTAVVVPAAGSAAVASDLVLALSGTFSGTFRAIVNGVETRASGSRVEIFYLEPLTGTFRHYEVAYPSETGAWRFGYLPAGTYRLSFGAYDTTRTNETVYWPSGRRFGEARDVILTPGGTVSNLDVVLPERAVASRRIAGADRYATSAAMSSSTWGFPDVGGTTPEVPVLYVASGRDFPDALSAGPAAARQEGALLLVDRDTIPTAVRDEILRLSPDHIVVVGGEAAISASVFRDLASLQPSVERIAGADRYETSRLVARSAFSDGAERIFVATGSNFADALSAGPAAVRDGGPVVLVRGTAPDVDAPTRDLVTTLGAPPVAIVGGYEAVSQKFQYSLLSLSWNERYAGPDRFATAVAVNASFGPGETAFVTSGLGFADALVAGAAAARAGAPLYLSEQSCVPEGVRRAVLDGAAFDVVLVGGTASLGAGVEGLSTRCG
ncbi:cell wall-binding repeat-containing protein [Frigoribacterium sp. Leaf186]|uniref:cell wall-binding repeat-containing protein n=1 Tax=Frigoribacterium sp. Leaf186 TaxID=1736293 RepID=UPI00070057C3|nr:cell wall-binding repeat-containing protein [Frigoribacterium sp. Leaf186]KQS22806.1 hypothetical protein ASG05_04760 [Frigoribacterium sp. Leaf186]